MTNGNIKELEGAARLAVVAIALLGLAASTGCGGGTRREGGLLVVVSTDLALPKDLDRLTLDVTQGGRTLLHQDQQLGAGHLLVPAEFRISPSGSTAPALVRGVAYKNGQPAIERSAITPIPTSSVGVVQLAMNYLCVGTANADGTSTCGADKTCKQGACQTAVTVTEVHVAGHSGDAGADAPAAADGGIVPTANGCFDVGACFAAATAATVEPVSCSVPLPAQADAARLNVALELPAGGSGVCTPTACFVVLDRAVDGWTVEGSRILLPPSICQPRAGAKIPTVVVTTSCAAKSAGTAVCGNWSRATTPIETPPPPAPIGDACNGAAERPCGNCGKQSRTCRNGTWSDWGACSAEGACAPNASQTCGSDGTQTCGGSCQWGACTMQTCAGPASQACGSCGTQTRTCDGDTGAWSAWGACAGEAACAPNATQACGSGGTQTCGGSCQWGACAMQACAGPASQACGNCGTQTRTCDGNTGMWSAWGACAGEGACAPNASQACGSGGRQSCGGSCQWGACAMQTCTGAASQACGNCGTQTRTCDGNTGTWSAWGACTGEGPCAPSATRTCGSGGTQICAGSCQWSAACTGQSCTGPASEACGNCGTQTRTCDGNTGMWSAWGACTAEGDCASGATRTCGAGGTQTCDATCHWAAACPGQSCTGPASEACGNCGTHARTCDTSTGMWSAWGACTAEGDCAPVATRACGSSGTQTCDATCRWGAACTGQVCTGVASEACGNCGTHSRTCDSNTGMWSAWGACGGEGACMPGTSQSCGANMSQTCSAQCAWATCGCGSGFMTCGAACVNTASDANNCGTCGNVCQFGRTCSAGACVCATGAVCGTVLATSARPHRLAVDGGVVYWTDTTAGTVNRVPAGGGATTTIYPGPGPAIDLAVAAGFVFFNNGGGTLVRIPTGGGTAVTLADEETNISLVKADATNAYYLTNYNVVRRVPIGGGTPATISAGPFNSNIIDMALDGGRLFWTNDGIWTDDLRNKMPGTAGVFDTAVNLPAGSKYVHDLNYPLYRIAVDANSIYWVGNGRLNFVPRNVQNPAISVLGTGFGSQEQAIISDGANLYWVTTSGHLYRMPVSGGTLTDLGVGGAATSLAHDASNVYWISGTSIFRRAK